MCLILGPITIGNAQHNFASVQPFDVALRFASHALAIASSPTILQCNGSKQLRIQSYKNGKHLFLWAKNLLKGKYRNYVFVATGW